MTADIGETRNEYNILGGKPFGMWPIRRPTWGWMSNITANLECKKLSERN